MLILVAKSPTATVFAAISLVVTTFSAIILTVIESAPNAAPTLSAPGTHSVPDHFNTWPVVGAVLLTSVKLLVVSASIVDLFANSSQAPACA